MSRTITLAAAFTLAALVACQRLKPAGGALHEAQAAHARGEDRAAVFPLKNLLRQEPGHGAARRLLGQLHLAQGDPVAAETELRRALALGQSRSQLLPGLVRAMLAQAAYQGVLDELQAEPPSAAVLAWRGHAQLGMGKAEDADQLYSQALHRERRQAEALRGQARLALLRNDAGAAAAAVERAFAADPRNAETLRFQGDLLHMRGELPAALAAYQAILKLDRNDVQAHADIAGVHLQAGTPARARLQLDAARKVQPNSLVIVYTQGLLD